ncbi:MAG: methyltransferase domain-containing protein [Actinomycetes bacterium]
MTALTPYDVALRTGGPCWVRGCDGAAHPLPLNRWLADADEDDQAMLSRCAGATLDVGCGPGRLTAALAQRGVVALGVDVSAEAVRTAHARGAPALCRDVFRGVPGERRWAHVLLADGNIGIGGDPVALLARTRDLLAPGGTVVADVRGRSTGVQRFTLRLEGPHAPPATIPWAVLGRDALPGVAATAGLTVRDVRPVGRRWVAVLGKG